MIKETGLVPYCTGIVFCGGRATRIHNLLQGTPKALITLGRQPYLVSLLQRLREVGVTEVVLCVSPFTMSIVHTLDDGTNLGVRIRYSIDSGLIENGGALWHCRTIIQTPLMLCINGDTIVDVDFHTLLRAHLRHGATATMVVSSRTDQPHVGGIAVRLDSWVDDILEEDQDRRRVIVPQRNVRYESNSGVYVVDKQRLLDDWPAEFRNGKLETGLLRYLARKRRVLTYDNGDRFLLDFGSPERWHQMQRAFGVIARFFPI